MSRILNTEVAYALPSRQSIIDVAIAEGATVQEVIEASRITQLYPDIDLKTCKVGIWSRTVKLSEAVKDGDRVEIYRPLIADPKEVRKRRAERAKEEGRADKVTGGRPNSPKGKAEDKTEE